MFFNRDNDNRQNKCSHTIIAGDTLYSLAIRNNTTVDNLLALNPGINPYNLQIGSVIRVCGEQIVPPIGEIPQPECKNLTYHIIRQGDTLYSLARYYNTTVDNILSYNEGIDPYNLQIGSMLTICVGDEYFEKPAPPILPLPPVTPVPPIFPLPPVTPVPPIFPLPPVQPPIGTLPPVMPIPPIFPLPPIGGIRPPVQPPIGTLPPVMPVPPIEPPIMPNPPSDNCDKLFILLWLLLNHIMSSRNMLVSSLNDLTCEKTAKQQMSTSTQNIIDYVEKTHGVLPQIASQANEMNTHMYGLIDAIKSRRTIEASKHRISLKQVSATFASTIAKHTSKPPNMIQPFCDTYISSMENQALARMNRRFADDAQLLDKLMLDTRDFVKNFHA